VVEDGPPVAGSLLARLKAETSHLHSRIEQVVPLLRPELDRPAYRRYLERLLGYLRPLEATLSAFAASWAAHGLDFEARRKTQLIERDLLALGGRPDELAALPLCAALPAARSLDEAWGCLYVLEGSTLGGQVILRTLGPRLQLSRSDGLSFLCGYGERTGTTWKAFAAAVGHFEASGCDRPAVVRGACETFSTQMDWLAGGQEGG